MGKLFGTDGVRGRAGQFPLDPVTIYRLAHSLTKRGMSHVIIGRDTRASGIWIEEILKEGIEAGGGRATLAGVITTPGVAYLARSCSFDAGVVISASHNPYWDNGIKIFSTLGVKLPDDEEEKIEREMASSAAQPPGGSNSMEGEASRNLLNSDATCVDEYCRFLTATLRRSLAPLRVVVDCANGAASQIAVQVFQRAGAEVAALFCEPDGYNINQDCGSLYPQALVGRVVEEQASLGVALDGDADRSIFVDEKGTILDGDFVIYIMARHLREQGKLKSGCVVTTVMANLGLEVALRKEGVRTIRTQVGDRYVLEEMVRGGHALGGEQSGHIIVAEHSLAGDGILTALQVAQLMLEKDCALGELQKGFIKFPQVLLNVKVREKVDFRTIGPVWAAVRFAEQVLAEDGRVIIRYSGTEPLVRIMLEGPDEAQIKQLAETIAARFQEELGTGDIACDSPRDHTASGAF